MGVTSHVQTLRLHLDDIVASLYVCRFLRRHFVFVCFGGAKIGVRKKKNQYTTKKQKQKSLVIVCVPKLKTKFMTIAWLWWCNQRQTRTRKISWDSNDNEKCLRAMTYKTQSSSSRSCQNNNHNHNHGRYYHSGRHQVSCRSRFRSLLMVDSGRYHYGNKHCYDQTYIYHHPVPISHIRI